MNTKTKHTPGPWKHYKNYHEGFYVKPADSYLNNPIAASCPGPNSEANARLIAAAPTMYNYLKKLAESGNDEANEILKEIAGL